MCTFPYFALSYPYRPTRVWSDITQAYIRDRPDQESGRESGGAADGSHLQMAIGAAHSIGIKVVPRLELEDMADFMEDATSRRETVEEEMAAAKAAAAK